MGKKGSGGFHNHGSTPKSSILDWDVPFKTIHFSGTLYGTHQVMYSTSHGSHGDLLASSGTLVSVLDADSIAGLIWEVNTKPFEYI